MSTIVLPPYSLIRKMTCLSMAISLAACSSEPLSSVSSLAPAIQGAAISDDGALADSSDQILLYNILRARDRRPLDLGTLSSFSGTLSLSGTAGFSFPFGLHVSTSNTGSPSVTASTSPTYAFTPLNNQGFTTAILQPISAAYVQNRWNSGASPELLLLLFVKNISFPVKEREKVRYVRYANDPDNPAEFAAFKNAIEIFLKHNAELKTFDIMDPVGPHFPFLTATKDKQLNVTAFGFVTAAGDAPYHAGNTGEQSTGSKGQLYRVYPGQTALCAPAKEMQAEGFYVPSLTRRTKTFVSRKPVPAADTASQKAGRTMVDGNAFFQALAILPFNTTATKGGSGPTTAAATPAPASTASTTAILQAGRYSSVVDSAGCDVSEIVLNRMAESDFAKGTDGFDHIEWRSVSEVFEYLGASLRSSEPNMLTWQRRDDAFVAVNRETATQALNRALTSSAAGASSEVSTGSERLFTLRPDGDFLVKYLGTSYGVASGANGDHTKEVLTMLGTLVNLANGATAASSQPLQLLPIP